MVWRRIADSSDVTEGAMAPVRKDGVPPIVLVRRGGEIFALHDRCTHGDWPLSDGYVEGDRIECSLHGGQFCVRTGAAKLPPASGSVTVYRVEEREGGIWIDAADT